MSHTHMLQVADRKLCLKNPFNNCRVLSVVHHNHHHQQQEVNLGKSLHINKDKVAKVSDERKPVFIYSFFFFGAVFMTNWICC